MAEPNWRALLAYEDVELQRPATPDAVERVEAALGTVLPAELRALYLVSDGVYHRSGHWFVIWPLADVLQRNSDGWVGWESSGRRHLIGFGDDGTGDPFCVPRDGGAGVLIWHPIGQEAIRLADTLQGFWIGLNSGTITT
ncbi:SMI1/KNR4 family protein [Paractinoplanes rishiriensis]|uniref:Knr4/Smi1-like domain-containing protein n=1 Tax=Paractinoplanes rishiriensis TaxID=1050105 RepID=A0A919K7L6_9ACTN|nr:SMI1/KNR4 family protein [Actinoplanes rishiriensis]GIF02452.1 hypothetical protein Ari01nite_99160 [Actinoplanes rishiriensis]